MNSPNIPNFNPAEESISWAKSDISNLKAGFSEFFTNENISIIEERDGTSGRKIVKMKISESVPFLKFKRHAVDALLHTKNSFDQATNIAATYLFGKKFKENFPWSQSPTHLEMYRLKKFPDQLRDPIKAQMPYSTADTYAGGNDLVRALAHLANNKHSVGFQIDASGGIIHNGDIEFTGNGTIQEFVAWGPNWDPVKQEVVLFTVKSDGVGFKLHEDSSLAFRVCLAMPEFSNPPEVGFALEKFLAATERNLALMKAACSD